MINFICQLDWATGGPRQILFWVCLCWCVWMRLPVCLPFGTSVFCLWTWTQIGVHIIIPPGSQASVSDKNYTITSGSLASPASWLQVSDFSLYHKVSQFLISISHIYHISLSMSVHTHLLLFLFLWRSPTNTFQEKITLVAMSPEMVQMKFWFFLNQSLPNSFILSIIQEAAKSSWSLSRDICIQWPDSLTKVLGPGGAERGTVRNLSELVC